MLHDAHARGVRLYPVPFDELLQKMTGEKAPQLSVAKRMANTMAVAASCALVRYDLKFIERALEDVFQGKKKVIELNLRACELAYEYILKNFAQDFPIALEALKASEPRIYLTGNQATALGKLAAGCTVQTYYPIWPRGRRSPARAPPRAPPGRAFRSWSKRWAGQASTKSQSS
jgi:2-oxoglutarate ferredoxin oxidoreductase subunit alpha